MRIALLLILASTNTPAVDLSPAAPINRTQTMAKVKIVEIEKIGPVDRSAARKGRDRNVRKRGDIILVEFF
jgi:hypothetical protein